MKNKKQSKKKKHDLKRRNIDQAALSYNKKDDKVFAIPEQKKYNITTDVSISHLIKHFDKVDKNSKMIVARKILERIRTLDIDINDVTPYGKVDFFNYLPKDIHPLSGTLRNTSYEDSFKKFFVKSHHMKTNVFTEYTSDIDSAIKLYLKKLHDTNVDIIAEKMKRPVYTYNHINRKQKNPVCLGYIEIYFVHGNYYDWKWVQDNKIFFNENNTLKSKNFITENIIKVNVFRKKTYFEKISKMIKFNKQHLVPRLEFDRYGNQYMKFNPKEDHPNNVENLNDFISENSYVMSDLHFGEKNQNDGSIINFINKTIKEDDVLIILGDLTSTYKTHYIKSIFRQIKCKHIFLIMGNHDALPLEFYYSIGIKGIYERFYWKEKGYLLSHMPCNKLATDINFHGHLHGVMKYPKHTLEEENKINCFYQLNSKPLTFKEWIRKLHN